MGEFNNSVTFLAEAVEMGMNPCIFEWQNGNHNIIKRRRILMNLLNIAKETKCEIFDISENQGTIFFQVLVQIDKVVNQMGKSEDDIREMLNEPSVDRKLRL